MSNAEELLGRRRVASAHCLVGSEHVAWMRWGCHSRDVGEQSQSPTAGVAAGMQVGAAEGPHDRPKWQQLLRAWGRDFCHTHYQSSAGAGGLLQAFGIQAFVDLPFHSEAQLRFFELSWTEAPKLPSTQSNICFSAEGPADLAGQLLWQSPGELPAGCPCPPSHWWRPHSCRRYLLTTRGAAPVCERGSCCF